MHPGDIYNTTFTEIEKHYTIYFGRIVRRPIIWTPVDEEPERDIITIH
jgi:hypothetical protein